MKLAIMQPYLFPYIGYFQLINAVDKFIIYDDVNYIKRGWINRNYIQFNGQKHLYSVPIKNASQNKLIKELEFNFNERWIRKFKKTLEHSYKKSPNYNEINNLINNIHNYSKKNISKFIYNSLSLITNYLGITTEILPSSSVFNNSEMKGEERILNICRIENANTYINPQGGEKLYLKNNFIKKNINLFFLKSEDYIYKQFNNNFIPTLSILDVMMFNTLKETQYLLNNYKLV